MDNIAGVLSKISLLLKLMQPERKIKSVFVFYQPLTPPKIKTKKSKTRVFLAMKHFIAAVMLISVIFSQVWGYNDLWGYQSHF